MMDTTTRKQDLALLQTTGCKDDPKCGNRNGHHNTELRT